MCERPQAKALSPRNPLYLKGWGLDFPSAPRLRVAFFFYIVFYKIAAHFGGARWKLHPGLIVEASQFTAGMLGVRNHSGVSLLDRHGAAVDSARFVGRPRAGALRMRLAKRSKSQTTWGGGGG